MWVVIQMDPRREVVTTHGPFYSDREVQEFIYNFNIEDKEKPVILKKTRFDVFKHRFH